MPGLVAAEAPGNAPDRERRWDAVTSLTVVIAGLLGLAFALLMPPFQFNDEHAHFARSYQISRGEFVGHPDPKLPSAVLASLLRYPEGFEYKSAPRTSVDDLFTGGSGDSTTSDPIGNVQGLRFFSHGILASQVYWTACYLPASVGIRIARLLNVSPVLMLYAARLMNLLFFLAALAAALLLAPNYRALTTAVALMPMTLQQAVAVSADSMTIALSLIGFALILYTREHAVSRRYLAIVSITVPLWVLCKNSLWALPLVLLISVSQFGGKARRASFVLGVTLATMIAALSWRTMTSAAFAQYAAADLARGVDFFTNARLLAIHPLKILSDLVIFPDPSAYIPNLIRQFIGTFGWEFHLLPLSFPYLEMLLVVACIERNPKPFTIAERSILFMVFAAALIQTYAMLFVIDGTSRNGHYSFWAAGVQGRYLIPFCLAGFLILKQDAITVPTRVLAPVVLLASTLCAVLALVTVHGFFYQ
jgi:uncharacterized membrane protein